MNPFAPIRSASAPGKAHTPEFHTTPRPSTISTVAITAASAGAMLTWSRPKPSAKCMTATPTTAPRTMAATIPAIAPSARRWRPRAFESLCSTSLIADDSDLERSVEVRLHEDVDQLGAVAAALAFEHVFAGEELDGALPDPPDGADAPDADFGFFVGNDSHRYRCLRGFDGPFEPLCAAREPGAEGRQRRRPAQCVPGGVRDAGGAEPPGAGQELVHRPLRVHDAAREAAAAHRSVVGRLDGSGFLEGAQCGLPVIPSRRLLGRGEMPVADQGALERRHLRLELPGVRVLRVPALRLGKGLFRLLQHPVLDGLPALRDGPGEGLRAQFPIDCRDALPGAGVVGVELDDAPERRPLLVESSGGTSVFGLAALREQLRQLRNAGFPGFRLRIVGPLPQRLGDVHPGVRRVPGRVRVLGRLQGESEAGFLVADELFRLLHRAGKEAQRRIGIAVAVGFEGLVSGEVDPFHRGIELRSRCRPGWNGPKRGIEAVEQCIDLRLCLRAVVG